MDILISFAPIKKNFARGNQMIFITKSLSKEKMTRSRIPNKYLKHKREGNLLLYTQQRYKCISLLMKTKINYYGSLEEKDISHNKTFWETVKSLLTGNSINSDKIYLNENGELIDSESKTSEVRKNFFSNMVKTLKIPEFENLHCNFENLKIQILRQF